MKQRKPILALLVAAALLPWLTVSARAADTDVMFSDPSVVVGNTVTVKGEDGRIMVATWTDGEYSYCISADAGLTVDELAALIAEVK